MKNIVVLIGRISSDLRINMSSSGKHYLFFGIAVQRSYKDRKTGEYEADFINCVAFEQNAIYMHKFMEKGRLITIQGSINSGRYLDKKSNQYIYYNRVSVESVEALEGPRDKKNTHYTTSQSSEIENETANNNNSTPWDIDDDELPF